MPKKTKEEKAAEKAAKKAADKARKEAAEAEKLARKKGANKKPQQQGPVDRKYSATSVGSASSEASPSPGGEQKSLAILSTSTLVKETSLDHSPTHTGPGQTGGQRNSQPVSPPHIGSGATGGGQRGGRPISPPHGVEILANKHKPILGILKQSSQPNFSLQEPPPIDRSDSESSHHYPETAVKSKAPSEETTTAGGREFSPPREASGVRHQSDSRQTTRQITAIAQYKQQYEDKSAEVAELRKQLQEKDRTIQVKTTELSNSQKDFLNMSRHLDNRNKELEKLQKSSTESAQHLNAQVVDLTGQVKRYESTAEQLRKHLEAKSNEKLALQEALAQAGNDHTSAQQQLRNQLEAAHDLTRQLQHAGAAGEEKIASLEERLQKALKEKSTLVENNIQVQETRSKAVMRISELTEQLKQKEAELYQQKLAHEAKMKDSDTQHLHEMKHLQEQVEHKTREIDQMKTSHDALLQAQHVELEKETKLTQQEAEIKELETQYAEQVKQFEEQLALKGREIEQLKIDHEAAIKELEVKGIQQEQEIEQEFVSEANQLKRAHETAMKELEDKHSEAMKQLTDSHNEQLTTMTLAHEEALLKKDQGYLAKLEKTRKDREQFAALTAPESPVSREQLRVEIEAEMHQSYKTQIDILEAELAEAKNSPPSEEIRRQVRAGFNKELEDLQEEYERNSNEKEEKISQLSNQTVALEQNINRLAQEKKTLQDSELALMQQLKTRQVPTDQPQLDEGAQQEIDTLKQQIENLTTENQQLQNEVDQARAQADQKLQSLNMLSPPPGPSPQENNSDDEAFHDAPDKMPSLGAPANFTDNEKQQHLKTQIDSLVQEKAELAKQLQEAAVLATGYKQSMADLQGKLTKEQRAMARLENTKQELTKVIEVAQIETGGSISRDQDSEAKFKHLRAKFLEIATKKVEQEAKTQKRIDDLADKVADRDEQLREQRKTMQSRLGQLEQQSRVITELRGQLRDVEKTNGDLQDEVHTLTGEVAAARHNEEEREKVADDILHAECHDYISKLEAEIKEWKTHCEKVQAEAHSLQASSRQSSVSAALDSEAPAEPEFQAVDPEAYSDYLQDQVTQLQEEVVQLKAEKEGLLGVSHERDKIQKRNLHLINTNRDINGKLETLTRQVASIKQQAEAWPPVKQRLESELEELQSKNTILEVQLSDYKEDFDKERKDRTKLAGKLEREKETYQTTILHLNDDIKELTDQVELLRTQISELTDERDNKEKIAVNLAMEKQNLENDHEALVISHQALEKKNRELAYQVTDMKRQCGEQLDRINALEKHCREKSAEISGLQKTKKEFEDLLAQTLEKLNHERALKDAFDTERKTKTEQIFRLQEDSDRVRAQLEADARRIREEAQKAQEESDQNTSMFTAEKMSLEDQLAGMEVKFKAKEKNLELSELEKQNLLERLQRSQDQVDDLSSELDDMKEKHEVALTDVRQLYEQVREKTAQVKTYSKQGESFKKQLEETAEQLHFSQQEVQRLQNEVTANQQQAGQIRHQWEETGTKLHKTQHELQRLNDLVKTMEKDAQDKMNETKANFESERLSAQSDLRSAKRKIQELERQLNAVASGGSSGAFQVEIDKRKALEQQLTLSKSKAEELFAKCVSRNAAIDKLKKLLTQHRVPIPPLDLDPNMPRAPSRRPPGQVIAQNQARNIPRKQASGDYEQLQLERPPASGYASLRGDPSQGITPAGRRVEHDSGDPTDVNLVYENDHHFQSGALPNVPGNNAVTRSTGQDYVNHDRIPQGLASQAPANINPTYATADPTYATTDPTYATADPTYANDANYYRGPAPVPGVGNYQQDLHQPALHGGGNFQQDPHHPAVPGGGNYQQDPNFYMNVSQHNKPSTKSPPKALPAKRTSHERFMETQKRPLFAQSPTNPPAASQAGPVPVPRRSSGSLNNQPRRPKINSDVQENPLLQNIDADIKAAVDYVIQEGDEPESMLPEAPFDPNLICPLCMRNFRVGEIQKYRKHVAECQGE